MKTDIALSAADLLCLQRATRASVEHLAIEVERLREVLTASPTNAYARGCLRELTAEYACLRRAGRQIWQARVATDRPKPPRRLVTAR